ncbi:hypothetical protein FHS15_004906 [Paenibacillus castaneae]|uniref:hypothetical protein n=1 Tax=Paenibacillus castaneae TaxID=474957 RepID=UPI000C9B1D6A|nr:hypothetical protein [Paenibacillus castaneae]NIK79739.1 hypothetical protein [Paenibacillus castaneae]
MKKVNWILSIFFIAILATFIVITIRNKESNKSDTNAIDVNSKDLIIQSSNKPITENKKDIQELQNNDSIVIRANGLKNNELVIKMDRMEITDEYETILKIYNEANFNYYSATIQSEMEIREQELKKRIMLQYAEQLGIAVSESDWESYVKNVNDIKDERMTNYFNFILEARKLTEQEYWNDLLTIQNQKTGLILGRLLAELGQVKFYDLQNLLWGEYKSSKSKIN